MSLRLFYLPINLFHFTPRELELSPIILMQKMIKYDGITWAPQSQS